jgi:hypothetical protein
MAAVKWSPSRSRAVFMLNLEKKVVPSLLPDVHRTTSGENQKRKAYSMMEIKNKTSSVQDLFQTQQKRSTLLQVKVFLISNF